MKTLIVVIIIILMLTNSAFAGDQYKLILTRSTPPSTISYNTVGLVIPTGLISTKTVGWIDAFGNVTTINPFKENTKTQLFYKLGDTSPVEMGPLTALDQYNLICWSTDNKLNSIPKQGMNLNIILKQTSITSGGIEYFYLNTFKFNTILLGNILRLNNTTFRLFN